MTEQNMWPIRRELLVRYRFIETIALWEDRLASYTSGF